MGIFDAFKTPSASTIAANTAKVTNGKTTTSNVATNTNGVTSTVTKPSATTYTASNVQDYLRNLTSNSNKGNTGGSTKGGTTGSGNSTLPSFLTTTPTDTYKTVMGSASNPAGLNTNAISPTDLSYIKAQNIIKDNNIDGTIDKVNGQYVVHTTDANGRLTTIDTNGNVSSLPTYQETKDYYNEWKKNNDGNNGDDDTGKQNPKNLTTYYDELMKAFMENNEAARQAALDAILQNLDAVKGTYSNQIQQIIDEYDNLVDQNEVKKARAARVLRENQANRGQLDSGMGRQEQLDMNLGYDKISSELNLARAQAVQEIYNLIAQAEAEANTNKANVNNTYNNAMLEYQLAQQ